MLFSPSPGQEDTSPESQCNLNTNMNDYKYLKSEKNCGEKLKGLRGPFTY